jgi:hypothetical protein
MIKYVLLILTVVVSAMPSFNLQFCHAEVVDRVVAFVDDDAITLMEFRRYYQMAKVYTPDLSEKKALDIMINRRLLLREARKIRLKGDHEDQLINEYIDIKIRAFIIIPPEEIRKYYRKNNDKFKGVPLERVRRSIERLLIERETNKRLSGHIEELRRRSYIRINMLNLHY